jgi:hypothetical protein
MDLADDSSKPRSGRGPGPQLIIGADDGRHNREQASVERISRGRLHHDLSTVCVIPTLGLIAARVVECWWQMLTPINQRFQRMFVQGMEVADAYNVAVERILADPQLSSMKYLLTLEDDNMPPPRGLLKLYESMHIYSAVGGLYWSQGEDGWPMIYGRPGEDPMFAPQPPQPDIVQECNGLGMGFTLFRLDLFRDERLTRPWFKQVQGNDQRGEPWWVTQDLYFFERIRTLGYRVACDTRVKVGHHDAQTGIVW